MLSIEPGDAAKLVECLTSMYGNPGLGHYIKGVTAPACTFHHSGVQVQDQLYNMASLRPA